MQRVARRGLERVVGRDPAWAVCGAGVGVGPDGDCFCLALDDRSERTYPTRTLSSQYRAHYFCCWFRIPRAFVGQKER